MKYQDSCDGKEVFDNITLCRSQCEKPISKLDGVSEDVLTCIKNNQNSKFCCESVATIQHSIRKDTKISLAIGGIFAALVVIFIISYCIVIRTKTHQQDKRAHSREEVVQ